jgi:hypothetical protein
MQDFLAMAKKPVVDSNMKEPKAPKEVKKKQEYVKLMTAEMPKITKGKKSKKPKEYYGIREDGTKICDKCKNPFTPAKFTPYQKLCDACRGKGKNVPKDAKKAGSGLIDTVCNMCGMPIRINPNIYTAHCNNCCPPEEKIKRDNMVEEDLEHNFNKGYESEIYGNNIFATFNKDYVFVDKLISNEYYQYGSAINKFTASELACFKPSLEIIYALLLLRGFKLSKSHTPFKEYNNHNGKYTASLMTPENGIMGFSISYPDEEKTGTGKGKVVRTRAYDIIIDTNKIARIPFMPEEMINDISLLLELKMEWRKREVRKQGG